MKNTHQYYLLLYITFSTMTNSADIKLVIFVSFSSENKVCYFMQMVCEPCKILF